MKEQLALIKAELHALVDTIQVCEPNETVQQTLSHLVTALQHLSIVKNLIKDGTNFNRQ